MGIAREFTRDQTETQTSLLSAGYAPIEQYLSRAKRTPATDVYGLAATFYSLLTGVAPIASILRHRQPLMSPRDLRPELSPVVSQAVMRGMALEIDDRPANVEAWLSLLPKAQVRGSQAFSITTQSNEMAATVAVAPVYHAQPEQVARNTEFHQNTASYKPPTATVAAKPRKRSGCGGIFWTLTALSTITLAALGLGAFGLYQKLTQGLSDVVEWATTPDQPAPDLSNPPKTSQDFPSVEFPPITLETVSSEESEPTSSPPDSADPPPELAIDSPADALPADALPTDTLSTSTAISNRPLLLANAGDPANPRLQTSDVAYQTVPVRGFSPGSPESEIRKYLGEPDQVGAGYWPNTRVALYELMPNRATLAYFYDRDTGQVRQSEAAFAQSMHRLAMRMALIGMLDSRSTVEIEKALDQVRSRRLNRYLFEHRQFRGVIERNQYDQIHIQIWDIDFH